MIEEFIVENLYWKQYEHAKPRQMQYSDKLSKERTILTDYYEKIKGEHFEKIRDRGSVRKKVNFKKGMIHEIYPKSSFLKVKK